MRRALAAFLIGMSALAFAGCSVGGPENPTNPDVHSNLDGHYTVGDITVDGHDLRCVTMERDSGGNAQWGGLSCDWVAYHHDNDPVPTEPSTSTTP